MIVCCVVLRWLIGGYSAISFAFGKVIVMVAFSFVVVFGRVRLGLLSEEWLLRLYLDALFLF